MRENDPPRESSHSLKASDATQKNAARMCKRSPNLTTVPGCKGGVGGGGETGAAEGGGKGKEDGGEEGNGTKGGVGR